MGICPARNDTLSPCGVKWHTDRRIGGHFVGWKRLQA